MTLLFVAGCMPSAGGGDPNPEPGNVPGVPPPSEEVPEPGEGKKPEPTLPETTAPETTVVDPSTSMPKPSPRGMTPVDQYGRRQVAEVDGKAVVAAEDGEQISLAGPSLFWSGYNDASKFYEKPVVRHFAESWQSEIIRVAMQIEQDGFGYVFASEQEIAKVDKIVEEAIDQGIYVIIDFHTHVAPQYEAQAVTFFKDMATRYGETDNVIYEVFNEPIGEYEEVQGRRFGIHQSSLTLRQ